MKTQFYIIVVGLLSAIGVAAQTDVQQQIDRLQENYYNSDHNMKQYQKNLGIVDANLRAINQAKKDLNDQKIIVDKAVKEMQKNGNAMANTKKELNDKIQMETAQISLEQKQVEELNRIIANLQKNMEQRRVNIQAYQNRLGELDEIRMNLANRSQEILDLKRAIDEKHGQVVGQHQIWSKKKQEYYNETQKWKNHRDRSIQLYENFKNLE